MFVSALVMTVASNFLTDALPLIIRPKPRGVSPFKNLDADGLPLVGLDEIGVSAFLSGREKHQHILGAGLNIAPIGGEAAIAFFKFQIHPWHQATTTKLGTAISSTPSDVMLRQRERANHDGSTSPVGRYVQAISAGDPAIQRPCRQCLHREQTESPGRDYGYSQRSGHFPPATSPFRRSEVRQRQDVRVSGI